MKVNPRLVPGSRNESRNDIVMAVDPTQTVAATGNPTLGELAEAVKVKLARAPGVSSPR